MLLRQHNVLDGIEDSLTAELGERVRERRATLKIREDGSVMTPEELAHIFNAVGVPMTAADVLSLESGQWRIWDVKTLAALVFLLEISLDEAFTAYFQSAASEKRNAAP